MHCTCHCTPREDLEHAPFACQGMASTEQARHAKVLLGHHTGVARMVDEEGERLFPTALLPPLHLSGVSIVMERERQGK